MSPVFSGYLIIFHLVPCLGSTRFPTKLLHLMLRQRCLREKLSAQAEEERENKKKRLHYGNYNADGPWVNCSTLSSFNLIRLRLPRLLLPLTGLARLRIQRKRLILKRHDAQHGPKNKPGISSMGTRQGAEK